MITIEQARRAEYLSQGSLREAIGGQDLKSAVSCNRVQSRHEGTETDRPIEMHRFSTIKQIMSYRILKKTKYGKRSEINSRSVSTKKEKQNEKGENCYLQL